MDDYKLDMASYKKAQLKQSDISDSWTNQLQEKSYEFMLDYDKNLLSSEGDDPLLRATITLPFIRRKARQEANKFTIFNC